jgi:rubrerythrin
MGPLKQFSELSEREILALAISLEEQHSRIYRDYADGLGESYPASAKVFLGMADEEDEHRRWLIDTYRARFGEHIPLVRPEDIRGFARHKPLWLVRPLGLDAVRQQAEAIELETRLFYERAQSRATDAGIRKLLGDLALAERGHESLAEKLRTEYLTRDAREGEEATRQRLFVLRVVQPGLAGLMDGSVSTLAPLFAAAFATQNTWETFLVGMAASVGAGISMGYAEAISD